MSNQKTHITSYGNHLFVLLCLITLTFITVAITSVQLGAFNTTAAMIIAATKAVIVLLYFMHLKFDDKIFRFMAMLVLAVYAVVIVITFFDYLYR